ncbi:STAS domain-containing protein [Streptomyces lavendulae]|uniref:STAS domain-containing protein n=1 Tax=Streptomyces lavendulae TaxID=1914 RepID=UPI0033E47F9D
MTSTEVQRCGSTFLIGISGALDEGTALVLQQALDQVTAHDRVLMIDVHGVASMDPEGLLLFLDLHRRAEWLGLRVLVVGWQPQPQQLMAEVAGLHGRGSSSAERYSLAGFRRLIEKRAQHETLPHVLPAP